MSNNANKFAIIRHRIQLFHSECFRMQLSDTNLQYAVIIQPKEHGRKPFLSQGLLIPYSFFTHFLLMPRSCSPHATACFPLANPLLNEAFSPLVLHLFSTLSSLVLHVFFIATPLYPSFSVLVQIPLPSFSFA